MNQIIALLTIFFAMAPVGQNLNELLPPDGTPNGWQRDGDSELFDNANAGSQIGSNANAYVNNGLQQMVTQYYRNGAKEIRVDIYDMGSSDNAMSAFETLTSGKTVEYDLGEGMVFEIENAAMVFYTKNYVINISSEVANEEMNQAISILAMTIDATLF